MHVKNHFTFVKDSLWILPEIHKANEGFEIRGRKRRQRNFLTEGGVEAFQSTIP